MENLTGGTPPVRYLPCVVPCKLYFTEKYDNVEVLIAREDAAMGACRIAQARLKDAE